MQRFCIILLMMISICGCTSFRTTIVQRGSDNRFCPNFPTSKTKGLPVKLKVPTHIEATITEKFFVESVQNAAGPDGAANTKNRVQCREIGLWLDGQRIRHLEVDTKVIYTEKVFTVDFRRPAGGLLNLSTIDFDSEQYFKQVKANYEEKTLSQITSALNTLKPGLTGRASASNLNGLAGILMDTRTVAVARFDISETDWESQLQCFVDHHITSCYSGCEYQN